MTDNSQKLIQILEQKRVLDEVKRQHDEKAIAAENEKLAKLENAKGAWQSAYAKLKNALAKVNESLSPAGILISAKEEQTRHPALARIEFFPVYGEKFGKGLTMHVSAYGKIQVSPSSELKMLSQEGEAEKLTIENFEQLLLDLVSYDLARRTIHGDL